MEVGAECTRLALELENGGKEAWALCSRASSASAAKCPGDGERAPRLTRSRRTVKINSEGRCSRPGVARPCGHGPLPGAAERLGEPGILAARWARAAEPEGPGRLPDTSKRSGGLFVWR